MAKKDKKQLTKAEMQVMNALWSLPDARGHASQIMERLPEPKPAQTTLLTFLKILKEKGFVTTLTTGKPQLYTVLVGREDYTRQYMAEVKNTFFGGSLASLVSFFVRNEQLDDTQVDELMDIIRQEKHL